MRIMMSIVFICLTAFACPARAAYQQVLLDWDKEDPGTPAGAVTVSGDAVASQPTVQPWGADMKAAALDFDFTAESGIHHIQAESTVVNGLTRYPDKNASGGFAMGEFGETAGDFMEIAGLPASEQINFWYNNGTGAAKQASLYVDGVKKATLTFPDTGGWFSPFQALSYKGHVSGTIRVQVDPDDLALNKTFCCNLDSVTLGPVRETPSLEVALPLPAVPLTPATQSVSIAVSRFPGVMRLGVEDSAGGMHWSMRFRHKTGDEWGRFTVLAHDFEPALAPESMAAGLKSLRVKIVSDGTAQKGVILLHAPMAAEGWPSTPPAGNPFEDSAAFAGLRFTGRHKEYTNADTWYPTEAEDGTYYSPYTDGKVSDVFVRSDNYDATTGMAKIEGDDPMSLTVTDIGCYRSSPWPLATRYPCGSLIHDGVWYYGTYILNGDGRPDGNYTFQGPFVGFRTSTDFGKTWTETPCTPQRNLFSELVDAVPGGYTKIKMGSPHFVDFGRNMEHSPDGKAYLIAHGNRDITTPQSWILGDGIYLARVTPSIESINDITQYEFYAGRDAQDAPVWTRDFAAIQPLYEWMGKTGCVTATYNAPLRKYFMCVSTGRTVDSTFDTYILEADALEGPWRMVDYMQEFGRQAYFVNIPSKYISEDGKTMWLSYSTNWTGHEDSPRGGTYALCLNEVTLAPRE